MAAKTLPSSYPAVLYGFNQLREPKIESLFKELSYLKPMDKNGPMSGRCDLQTVQMEQFLKRTFGFENTPGKYVVPGVQSFKLAKSPDSMPRDTIINFPGSSSPSFAMTAQEIGDWQRSYRIYADKNIKGMNKEFLDRAVRGHSRHGEEAFRMKFVVRISTCPVLMEFDGDTISRKTNEDWPNNIKLVSVTGIDFAGRIHDVGDIRYYILNWRDVFDIDPKTGLLAVYGGRDFRPKMGGPPAQLHEERVRNSLIRMARLRLQACDKEGIQIVVETGIGLGIFAGSHIGIDAKVRALSAYAIRQVLQEDGLSYKNIRAVVFALPLFSKTRSSRPSPDTFDDFADEFCQAGYNGPIPVLIADQDMHRLTVAIAHQGFIVSELNPADSHGVFGEYWQNRGPAVEEKLALTTVGLLVQHHFINPHVVNTNNYHFLDLNRTSILDWESTISQDDEKAIVRRRPYQ